MYCKTEVGRWYLQETLSKPFKMVDGLVAQRQAWIHMLYENPEVKQQIDELLTLASEYEKEAQSLLSDFFKGKACAELKELEATKQRSQWLYAWNKLWTCNPILRSISFARDCAIQGCTLFGIYKLAENYSSIKQSMPEMKAISGLTQL